MSNLLSSLHRSVQVVIRNMVVWRRYVHVTLLQAFGEPMLYVVAMGLGLGKFIPDINGVKYVQFIAPALFMTSSMHTSVFETTFTAYTRLDSQKTYQAAAITPLSLSEIMIGEIMWAACKCVLPATMMYVVFIGFGLVPASIAVWMQMIALVLLNAWVFAGIGLFTTSFAKGYDHFTFLLTLAIEPMFLFSGTFFPLSNLPEWAQNLAWCMPLSHSVAIARDIILGGGANIGLHALLLVSMALLFSTIAVRRMVKRLTL